jgi:hypothetical protein
VASCEVAVRLWKQSGYLNGWLKGQKPHIDNASNAGIRTWNLQNMKRLLGERMKVSATFPLQRIRVYPC